MFALSVLVCFNLTEDTVSTVAWNVDIYIYLIYCFVVLNVQNGNTALMMAVRNNRVDIVDLLMTAGADVTIESNVCVDVIVVANTSSEFVFYF